MPAGLAVAAERDAARGQGKARGGIKALSEQVLDGKSLGQMWCGARPLFP